MERAETIFRHLRSVKSDIIASDTASATQVTPNTHHGKYRYTVDQQQILTEEQRKFYEDNGYIVIPKLVADEEIEKYKQRFVEICNGARSPGMIVMQDVANVKEGQTIAERTINKVQDYQEDPELFSYCHRPEVLRYVESFTGPNIMGVHTMLISKPPDPGTKTSRHPMHQDLHYFPFRPADHIVASWTAMEKITRQNGCLVVIPGTHKGELLEHGYPQWGKDGGVNKMYHGILNYSPEKDARIHLEMEKGDTVFFHPLLIHGSGMNKTKGYRKAISCHFAASECDYIDVEGTTQANIAEEVLQLAKKRFGDAIKDVTFQDTWRFRARLLKGIEVTM